MQEILDELEVSDVLSERQGKDSRQQQSKQASEVRQESSVPRDGSKVYLEYKELQKKRLK